MKLKWETRNVTTPGQIESHNNMVETLWKWRHAGLVVETEQNERLPELIETPKRVVKCECGNDDLSCFTVYSLNDVGRYSFCRYEADGGISCSWDESDFMGGELGVELGLARKLPPGKTPEGDEITRYEWLWLISCDKCKKREKIWSEELTTFVDFC